MFRRCRGFLARQSDFGKHVPSGCPGVTLRSIRVGTSGFKRLVVCCMLAGAVLLLGSDSVVALDLTPNPVGDGVIVTDQGLVLPVSEIREKGFFVTTPCRNEALVTSGVYISDVDIVIDPGHGGKESGALGPDGLKEKDLNLTVAEMTATFLEARGYRVLLTRTSDVRVTVLARAEIARALKPEVFVSIHHNGGAKRLSTEPGTEMYHPVDNPDAKRLAGILYEDLSGAFSAYDIKWRATALRGANAVIRQRDGKDFYGLFQYTPGMTTVITEAAYITNAVEETLLSDPAGQAVEASAIADGIVRYLTTSDEGSGYNGTSVTKKILYSGGASGCVDPALNPETDSDSPSEKRYNDVAGSHRSAVHSLLGEGVLDESECGQNLFCPDNPIKRWMLAVWLVRILDDTEPEAISETRFADIDPDQWWAPYVERLSELGITYGCAIDPARFCPDDHITREEMASFLVRAFRLTADTSTEYADISGNSHSGNIDIATASGVIEACGVNPDRYCPDQPATRAQAATFLVRGQELLTQGKPDTIDDK